MINYSINLDTRKVLVLLKLAIKMTSEFNCTCAIGFGCFLCSF